MLKMSFYDGTLNEDTLRDFIKITNKPIYYTHGLTYRNPTTHNKPVDKAEALRIVNSKNYWLDATEREDGLYLNTYSSNDMW